MYTTEFVANRQAIYSYIPCLAYDLSACAEDQRLGGHFGVELQLLILTPPARVQRPCYARSAVVAVNTYKVKGVQQNK